MNLVVKTCNTNNVLEFLYFFTIQFVLLFFSKYTYISLCVPQRFKTNAGSIFGKYTYGINFVYLCILPQLPIITRDSL